MTDKIADVAREILTAGIGYIVGYDLHKNSDYGRVEELLEKWAGIRLQESIWFVKRATTATTLKDDLLNVMLWKDSESVGDDGDRLLVVQIGTDVDWFNLKCDDAKAKALLKGI